MKFKPDENFGVRTSRFFRSAGHNIRTIAEESLAGASDQQVYETCRTEKRCLVTLDLDFADVLRFPLGRARGSLFSESQEIQP